MDVGLPITAATETVMSFLFGHYLFKTNIYKQIPKIHTQTLFDSSRKKIPPPHMKDFVCLLVGYFSFPKKLTIFKNNAFEKLKY